jgi:hypothetical protein
MSTVNVPVLMAVSGFLASFPLGLLAMKTGEQYLV